jgi:hypothetical protein
MLKQIADCGSENLINVIRPLEKIERLGITGCCFKCELNAYFNYLFYMWEF